VQLTIEGGLHCFPGCVLLTKPLFRIFFSHFSIIMMIMCTFPTGGLWWTEGSFSAESLLPGLL